MTAIAKRNAKFACMTKAQQRVAIAKDVLRTLDSGKIRPTRGVYLKLEGKTVRRKDVGSQWCDKLKDVEVCEVCAKGAIFVAAALRFNRFKISDDRVKTSGEANRFYDVDICDLNERYFSKRQLEAIEEAFEEVLVHYGAYANMSSVDAMIAIMQNIIKNNGRFVPPKWNSKTEKWE